jgi:hypothetical protein
MFAAKLPQPYCEVVSQVRFEPITSFETMKRSIQHTIISNYLSIYTPIYLYASKYAFIYIHEYINIYGYMYVCNHIQRNIKQIDVYKK